MKAKNNIWSPFIWTRAGGGRVGAYYTIIAAQGIDPRRKEHLALSLLMWQEDHSRGDAQVAPYQRH